MKIIFAEKEQRPGRKQDSISLAGLCEFDASLFSGQLIYFKGKGNQDFLYDKDVFLKVATFNSLRASFFLSDMDYFEAPGQFEEKIGQLQATRQTCKITVTLKDKNMSCWHLTQPGELQLKKMEMI